MPAVPALLRHIYTRKRSVLSQARHLLTGASPRRARSYQPPLSSVADAKEIIKQIDSSSPFSWEALRDALNVPNSVSEPYTENPLGHRGDRIPQSNSTSLPIKHVASVLRRRKPTPRDRHDEIPDGLPGQVRVPRRKRNVEEPRTPPGLPHGKGGVCQRQEGHLMGHEA